MKYYLKKSYLINIVIFFISIIVSCVIFRRTNISTGYENYFLVPFIFGVMILISPNINYINLKNIGSLILNCTMIIKYLFLPLISCLGEYYSWLGVYPSISDINKSIFYTIYELIIICFLSNLLSKYYSKINKKKKIITEIKPLRGIKIHILISILGLLTIFIFPQTVADYRFIFDISNLDITVKVDFPLSGILKTIIIFGRYSAIIVVINYFYKRNKIKESYINVFGAFLPVLLNSLYVSNLSRINIFAPIVVFSIIIYTLFDSKKSRKIIVKLFIFIGILFISYLSMVKFFGEGRGNEGNANNIKWWGDTLNMYFSGVKETAIGIKGINLINDQYGIWRFKLMINDLISNIIGLSNFSIKELSSTTLYNIVYFNKNNIVCQIVPNIIEGVYYFGSILAPIWPSIFVYLTYKFEEISSKCDYMDFKFVYLYASVYCSMVLMVNSTMIISNIVNISILFYLVAFLTKKIKIRF